MAHGPVGCQVGLGAACAASAPLPGLTHAMEAFGGSVDPDWYWLSAGVTGAEETGPCPQQASLGLFPWSLSHGPEGGQGQASPHVHTVARSLLASCFVISRWPKPVSRPSPDSRGRNRRSLGGKCGTVGAQACTREEEEFVAVFAVCHTDP